MEQRTKSNLPPEYEFLAAPLHRAQEHVFLINAEIEKLQDNPVNEQKTVKLDDEKNIIIQGLSVSLKAKPGRMARPAPRKLKPSLIDR